MIEMDDINRKLDEAFEDLKKYPSIETTLSSNQFGRITLSLSKKSQHKKASLKIYSGEAKHFPEEDNSLSLVFAKDFPDYEWLSESVFFHLLKVKVENTIKTFLQEFEATNQKMESLGLICTGYSSYGSEGIVFELDPLYGRTLVFAHKTQTDDVDVDDDEKAFVVDGTDLEKALVEYGKSSADRFMSLPEKARDYILGNPEGNQK